MRAPLLGVDLSQQSALVNIPPSAPHPSPCSHLTSPSSWLESSMIWEENAAQLY
jgi:hypothetical protein